MNTRLLRGANLFLGILLFLVACDSINGPKIDKNKGLVIALQPLQFEEREIIDSITHYINTFYSAQVVVFKNKTIPDEFIDRTKGLRYSASSIISHLRKSKPDSVSLVVGITGNDIYITKRDKKGNIKKPEYKYAVWGIFGLGYMPGESCVVSIHRLRHENEQKMYKRIHNVVLHEVGHNLGLDHCPNNQCIMTDANETIATIDNGGEVLCEKCKHQLIAKGYIKK